MQTITYPEITLKKRAGSGIIAADIRGCFPGQLAAVKGKTGSRGYCFSQRFGG